MVRADNGRVAGKDQQRTGTDRHLGLQDDRAEVATQQRDDLRREDRVPYHL